MWEDVRLWPSWVEGFGRLEEQGSDWPAVGSQVVWVSGPGGRGRVTEKVVIREPTRFGTSVFEERLRGLQTLEALEDGEGSRVRLSLEYELTSESPLRGVTDVLFIRRALRDALTRTLRRFTVEAQEHAGLR
jgi:hypothetical protein